MILLAGGKIKDDAIGGKKIKDDAIGTKKIKDDAIGTKKIKDGAIKTKKIADGAITEDKLSFSVAKYASTIIVSPVLGDPTQSGLNLLDAMESITDNSLATPYLLKIEPGLYDLGATPLQLKPYVDIEGSGQLVTKIIASNLPDSYGTITALNGSNTEVRFLTIENIGGGTHAISISVFQNEPPQLSNVILRASGSQNNFGVYNGTTGRTLMRLVSVRIDADQCAVSETDGFHLIAGSELNCEVGENCRQYHCYNDIYCGDGVCDLQEEWDGSCPEDCPCIPSCEGKVCGDDGCGGSCGTCAEGLICSEGACIPECVPECNGGVCGPDGCGGSCGTCSEGLICSEGACIPECVPECNGGVCGPDGCGGSCGDCSEGLICLGGACIPECVPECGGKECGTDGCGGICGICADVDICIDGICQTDICEVNDDCAEGQYCSREVGVCGGSQGTCAAIPEGCATVWDPVCGCTGETYGNACLAAYNGVNVSHVGECL